jgi:hypothetical protein
MYAAYLDGRAAVGFTGPAGDAMATGEIGDDGDRLAGLETGGLIEVHEIAGQLVTQDTGIAEKGLCAFISMEIGTADADTADPDDGMPGTRQRRICLMISELSGLYTN